MSIEVHFINPNADGENRQVVEELLALLALKHLASSSRSKTGGLCAACSFKEARTGSESEVRLTAVFQRIKRISRTAWKRSGHISGNIWSGMVMRWSKSMRMKE